MLDLNPDRMKRMARTIALLAGRRTDSAWWQESANLYASWQQRTAIIAKAIPDESVVLEFGAGAQVLRALLPPKCRYFPSDVVPRTSETIVCDLNARPLPALSHLKANVAVFSGVLEYVHEIDWVAQWLAGVAPVCIASYCPAKVRFPGERMLQAAIRAQYGWVSSLTAAELVRAFELAGFRGSAIDSWGSHLILLLERES